MWDDPIDGKESRLWGVALNSDGEYFVGRRLTGVAEPWERRIRLMGRRSRLRRSPYVG
jgi:hypothetical protein